MEGDGEVMGIGIGDLVQAERLTGCQLDFSNFPLSQDWVIYLIRHVSDLVLAVGSFLGDLRRGCLTLLDFVFVRPSVQCLLKRALENLWTDSS